MTIDRLATAGEHAVNVAGHGHAESRRGMRSAWIGHRARLTWARPFGTSFALRGEAAGATCGGPFGPYRSAALTPVVLRDSHRQPPDSAAEGSR